MARQALKKAPRKIKRVKVSKLGQRLAEEKGFGPEPAAGFDFTQVSPSVYTAALGWYARFTDIKEVEDHIALAMKNRGYDAKAVAAMKRSSKASMTLASISQLLNRECVLSQDSIDWWTEKVDAAVNIGSKMHEERVASGEVVSIRDRLESKSLDFIGDIDEIIDQVWIGTLKIEDVNVLSLMNELTIRPAHAKILEPIYREKLQAMAADWKEYPRDYNKADVKILQTIYQKVIEGLTTLSKSTDIDKEAKKMERAAKKAEKEKNNVFKTVKRETAAVINLKYKPSDNELGIISAKPASIVGAQIAIVFNTKYNVLTLYRAATADGLSVKGTTILGYDEVTSESKRAGRSAAMAIIKQIPNASKSQAIKLFQSIKGSAVTLRGRTSEEVLLIKTAK